MDGGNESAPAPQEGAGAEPAVQEVGQEPQGRTAPPERGLAALRADRGETDEHIDQLVEDNDEVQEVAPEDGKRRFVVKVDGEEREISEEELVSDYQLKQASYKRMQEAASERKALTSILEGLQQGNAQTMEAFMQKLGKDPLEFAEYIARKYVERAQMSDEERQKHDLQSELDQMRAEREHYQKERYDRALEQETQVQYQQILGEYDKVLTGNGFEKGSPAYELMVRNMARAHRDASANGVDIPIADLYEMTRRDMEALAQQYVRTQPADKLASGIGEERMRELRQHNIQQLPTVRKIPKGGKAENPFRKPKKQALQTYRSGSVNSFRDLLDE